MEELAAALRANRLATLHGMGGVGKTRLAVETVLARGKGLPRELVFVSLETTADTEDGLLSAIRDAFGLTEVDAPDVTALCKQLHGGDRLLLLDNFESVMSASSLVPRIARTAGVRVLVTSQQALGIGGEKVVELDPMTIRGSMAELESYRLFASLARQRDARWQPDEDAAMREVLVATDGLPYLIELVAAVAPKRQLRQLAEELKTHLTQVRARAGFAATERHASVQACLEWALGRLPSEERYLLPRLAVFAGSFDAKAAGEIAKASLASLDVLVDASLLRFDRDSGRYSMLPTTRQFARDLLDAEERVRLDKAHAEWFIEGLMAANAALWAKGGDAQRKARRWIDAEIENVQQAVVWTEQKEPAMFSRAVTASTLYLQQIGRFSEVIRLEEELLSRQSEQRSPKEWANTYIRLGASYSDLPTGDRGRNLEKSIACYDAALRIWTEGNSPADWAGIQNNLGIVYWKMPTGDRGENLAKAIAFYEAALSVWTERDFPAQWAAAQLNLGNAYAEHPIGDRGDNLAKAIACYEAALRVWTEPDFPDDWALAKSNLALAYANLPSGDRGENLAEAIACYNAALRFRTERDFPAGWAAIQNNLGIAYYNLAAGNGGENLANAIACYEAALRVHTEHDHPGNWANTQFNLGLAYEELAGGEVGADRQRIILCFESAVRGYKAVGLQDQAEDARKRTAALKATAS